MRKIETEARKINKQIYNLNYYYKQNYGVENLGIRPIKEISDKSYNTLKKDLQYTKQQIKSIKTSIKREKPILSELATVNIGDIKIKRNKLNKYQKAVEKENKRRDKIALKAFDYMTSKGRNPFNSVEEFKNSNQFAELKKFNINAKGHTQESFEEFMDKRLRFWSDTSNRSEQYKENFIYSVEHSNISNELQDKLIYLINNLTDNQISVLAISDINFQTIFNYKIEDLSRYEEEYEAIYDELSKDLKKIE